MNERGWDYWVVDLVAEIDKMRESSAFRDVRLEMYPGVPPEDIDEMLIDAHSEPGLEGFAVLDCLAAIYKESNSLYFYWERDASNGHVARGGAKLATFGEIYEPKFEQDQPFATIYEERRCFDDVTDEGTYLQFRRGTPEPELLYWLAATDTYYPMSITIEQYLQHLLLSRGLDPWPAFFVADKTFPHDWKVLERFLADMGRLFPESDATPFQRAFEKLSESGQ